MGQAETPETRSDNEILSVIDAETPTRACVGLRRLPMKGIV